MLRETGLLDLSLDPEGSIGAIMLLAHSLGVTKALESLEGGAARCFDTRAFSDI